jgi:hypothetical protein
VSAWPRGPIAEAVADEIWDSVTDRNEGDLTPAGKRSAQVRNDADASIPTKDEA